MTADCAITRRTDKAGVQEQQPRKAVQQQGGDQDLYANFSQRMHPSASRLHLPADLYFLPSG